MNAQVEPVSEPQLSPQLALLFAASAELLATRDPIRFIETLYARLAALLDVEIYVHFVVSPDRSHLTLAASRGFTAKQAQSLHRLEFGQAVCGTVARTCEPMAVRDVQHSDDPLTGLIRSFGITAYVCHPLMVEGELFGTLSFGTRKCAEFSRESIDLIRAVSDLTSVAIARSRAEQSLRDADRRKDEFLALLAHELRNPLAPIRSGIDLLRIKPDPAAIDATCSVMERQVEQLTRLVDDLMQVSRISKQKLQLSKTTVELSSIVATALDQVRPLLDKGGQNLSIKLPQEPLFLHGDPVRLSQVLGNLLDNAAKYTPEGGHISLTAERHGENVSLCVRDDGLGIEPEKLGWIFQSFHQVDHGRAPRGLGLGLSLVQSLVEMHGGTVEARSGGIGKGSEFTIRLPLLTGRQDAPASRRHDAAAAAATGRHRVLVVDDNVDAAGALGQLLEALGQETCVVFDGRAALDAGPSFAPHLVLLDIGMPDVNGYQVARQIRQQGWGVKVRIAALTGWSPAAVAQRVLDAGFDLCLTKPIDLADIEDLLRGLPAPADAEIAPTGAALSERASSTPDRAFAPEP